MWIRLTSLVLIEKKSLIRSKPKGIIPGQRITREPCPILDQGVHTNYFQNSSFYSPKSIIVPGFCIEKGENSSLGFHLVITLLMTHIFLTLQNHLNLS